MEIKGKAVIITGASAGIGEATARVFSAAGARVVLAARRAEKLGALATELAAKGGQVVIVPTDMRDSSAIKHMIKQTTSQYGTVDVLINNAGQAAAGAVSDISLEDFREIMALNVYGVVEAIQAVVPAMRQAGGGVIVNISSMVSKMHIPGLGAYAATKAALNSLSDTARIELAPDHIRVITIYPRMTATEFGRNSRGNQAMRQEQRAARPSGQMPPMDSADYVARRILQAVENEVEEQFME
jgi:NADP-dependent 3-hydroxy acid dehydrogenase YdfG